MKKVIALVSILTAFGCSSLNPRNPAQEASNPSASFDGRVASQVYQLLKGQKAYEDCDGRTCTVTAKDVSCSIERSLPGSECEWKIKLSEAANETSKDFDNAVSAALYQKIKAYEDCSDGRTCSVELKEISCTIERSLPDAECSFSK